MKKFGLLLCILMVLHIILSYANFVLNRFAVDYYIMSIVFVLSLALIGWLLIFNLDYKREEMNKNG